MAVAKDLLQLLAQKHKDDVFVPACKNGPTQNAENMVQLDAWAMQRSWAQPLTWGYEIKVHRRDFVGDQKWHRYLPYCNEFSFVCPPQLIKPDELPAEVGLLWVSSQGTRLVTKRKAVRRQVEIPEDFYRYILMNRTHIGGERALEDGTGQEKLRYWRAWLEEKRDLHDVGYQVSRKVGEQLAAMHSETIRMRALVDKTKQVQEIMAKLGVDIEHLQTWNMERDLRLLLTGRAPELSSVLQRAASALNDALPLVREFFDAAGLPE